MVPDRLTAQVSGQGHASLSELDATIATMLAAEGIPGATVAASKGGQLVFNKAYGKRNLQTGQPMTTSTRCRIGSTSKILTALGVMKLTEQFRFSTKTFLYGSSGILNETYWQHVGDYRPWSPFPPYLANSIRIDHLLSHSSGFTGNASVEDTASYFDIPVEEVTYEDTHAYYRMTHDLAFVPGQASEYCNHNLGLGTLVIERTARVPYWNYVRDQICVPIGLSNTWPIGKAPSGIDAAPHRYVSVADGSLDDFISPDALEYQTQALKPEVWDDIGDPSPLGIAAGGWASTARDLVRLMCATDKLPNQSDVLKPATIDLMESRPYPTGAPNHAHGWLIASQNRLWHNGSVGGGASYISKFPPGYISSNGINLSNVNVAICVNIQNAGALNDIVTEVARAVGKANIPPSYNLFLGLANP